MRWYRRAADAGHAAAMFMLGVGYESGKGVSKNARTASLWLRKAVAAGYELSEPWKKWLDRQ